MNPVPPEFEAEIYPLNQDFRFVHHGVARLKFADGEDGLQIY
jgi:hypothetical protein